jgi:transposase-like protein
MEGRQRRSFTDDYKRQAVDLVINSDKVFGTHKQTHLPQT